MEMKLPDFSIPLSYTLSVIVQCNWEVEDNTIADATDRVEKDLSSGTIVPEKYEVEVTHINGTSLEEWERWLSNHHDITIGFSRNLSYIYFYGNFYKDMEYDEWDSKAEAIEAALHHLWLKQNDR